MNLYKISQSNNNDYDTFDSAVVCAPDEATAKNMNPRDGNQMTEEDWNLAFCCWCRSLDQVKVELIGEAKKDLPIGIVVASFNAG